MKARWFLIVLFFCGAAFGELPPQFDTPEAEARYHKIIGELRCLVCQNQSLAESNAELAEDMRVIAAEMVQEGRSNEEIAAFFTARYGDFVLYRPPFNWQTAPLWALPFILVAGLLFGLARFLIRRQKEETAAEE